MELLEIAVVGIGAGVVSGLFGVGGGVVFVPALVFIFGLGQAEAQATSLLAIVPVAIVGSYRQNKYGNVAVRDGVWVGVLSLPAAVFAAWLANAIPENVLEALFVMLALYVAFRMFRRAFATPEPQPEI